MPQLPAVIIIVRHGQRLDAADKDWHLTSPAPYDPPLTYGGWIQSRVLGTRIASVLHSLSVDDEVLQNRGNEASPASAAPSGPSVHSAAQAGEKKVGEVKTTPTKRRRYKVVMHSSPFLRCVQTAVAMGAGMAQFQPPAETTSLRAPSPSSLVGRKGRSKSPRVRQPEILLSGIGSGQNGAFNGATATKKTESALGNAWEKPTLCIDACFGEWLNAEYYELITPPPHSTLMVAGAKADLLRRGDPVESAEPSPVGRGHFPGGWAKGGGSAPPVSPSSPRTAQASQLSMLQSIDRALPTLGNDEPRGGGSDDSVKPPMEMPKLMVQPVSPEQTDKYTPPTPSYAISPAGPIPRGYVAHARDACVDVAYQWDSMREPQDWGDGGEYGEEWSAMHKRFRRGLASMISWYSTHGLDVPLGTVQKSSEDEDDDRELALVIVTHGAGCNALLGALMDQPILVNVEMSSLSMAVRKPGAAFNSPYPGSSENATELPGRRRSSVTTGLSESYEMRLVASADHLLPDTDRNSSSPMLSPRSPEYRRRLNTNWTTGPPQDGLHIIEGPVRHVNSALGSMRRSASTNAGMAGINATRTPILRVDSSTLKPTGLWASPITPRDRSPDSSASGSDFLPNYGDANVPSSTGATSSNTFAPSPSRLKQSEDDAGDDKGAPLAAGSEDTKSSSQYGLWGASSTSSATATASAKLMTLPVREQTGKRRWTVNDS